MLREIDAVCFGELQRGDRLDHQPFSCGGAQCGGAERAPGIVEADQAGVESSVPEGGQQQAIVDVEAVGVGPALRPRYDVRGSEQTGIRNAGQGTAAVPISAWRKISWPTL